MPIAPKKYKGYAILSRPYYFYKNYWIPYKFNNQIKIIKELDSKEILYIETYELDGTKEQFMDVHIHVKDHDDKHDKNAYSYDIYNMDTNSYDKYYINTYSYDENNDLYSNTNYDEYIYFIDIYTDE